MVKVLAMGAIALGMAAASQAQFRQSIYLDFNLPTGKFASNVGNHAVLPLGYTEIGKDASVGFGLGYRASYRFDVGVGLVAPFVQGDFLWNTIGGTLNDEYTQARAKHTPTYFNIPLQIGVSYLYDELWSDITPYAEFGLGTDIMFITAEGECTYGGLSTMKYAYKPDAAFSFSIGLGAYFGRHVSAGLYYYGLGKHTVSYTNGTYKKLSTLEKLEYDNGDVQTRTAGSLALRIGFHF